MEQPITQLNLLYTETKAAIQSGHLNLAVLGCKELIDAISNQRRVKVTGTKAKIKKLIAKKIIDKTDEPILLKVINLNISSSRDLIAINIPDLQDFLTVVQKVL